jgi:hypothetical protein
MNSTGPWQPVELCAACGCELCHEDIYDRVVCPNCAITATFCLAVLRTAKRWVSTFRPSFWQRCLGKKASGYWEWSGKAENKSDTAALAKFMPGRRMAGGMNVVTIAAAGIASGLF